MALRGFRSSRLFVAQTNMQTLILVLVILFYITLYIGGTLIALALPLLAFLLCCVLSVLAIGFGPIIQLSVAGFAFKTIAGGSLALSKSILTWLYPQQKQED